MMNAGPVIGKKSGNAAAARRVAGVWESPSCAVRTLGRTRLTIGDRVPVCGGRRGRSTSPLGNHGLIGKQVYLRMYLSPGLTVKRTARRGRWDHEWACLEP